MTKIDELVPEPDGKIADRIMEYGVGVPATLLLFGAVVAYKTVQGASMWTSLTMYGRVGVVVIGAVALLSLASAGYVYAVIDTGWWLKTEEDDAQQPIGIGEED